MKLSEIVEKLKLRDEVDAVFITGSGGQENAKPYSDLDLVIILKENSTGIQSVYTWFDGIFADVFFFDHKDIAEVEKVGELSANAISSLIIPWLEKGKIFFDKSGKTTTLKAKAADFKLIISGSDKWRTWQNINYNYIANKRYFDSGDALYYKALELRLLYSVIGLISGYMDLRGVAWRGEKNVVSYLETNDPQYYALLSRYHAANNLQDRFSIYEKLVSLTLTPEYPLWKMTDVVATSKAATDCKKSSELNEFWQGLVK